MQFAIPSPMSSTIGVNLSSPWIRALQWQGSCRYGIKDSLKTELRATLEANKGVMINEEAKDSIRQMLNKVELSISAYDTAWVAMVPSLDASTTPCYPGSLMWIMENQLHDGSWGLLEQSPVLMKDALSSTLACVIALKRWQVGEEQIIKGLDFVRSNFASVMDESLYSPIGFDIIFPSMMKSAFEMDMNLCIDQKDLEALESKKCMELQRILLQDSNTKNLHLAYISEGLGNLHDWEMIMKYQKKNGSILNSPSATAAAFCQLYDSSCYRYLNTLVQQFGNAVPTIYPSNVSARLHLVDMLEKLGIDRHFTSNITLVLDEVYRLWMQGDEEIFTDIATRSVAFRLLRHHGYNVSSETLATYGEEMMRFNRFGGHLKDISDALEVFKASQMVLYPSESFLDEAKLGSERFLRQLISDEHKMHSTELHKRLKLEVQDALTNPYRSSLDRISTRTYIEHYDLDITKILKTSYRFKNLSNELLLKLAIEDFNYCQLIHSEELRQLKRWVLENGLDQLSFSRQKLGYCYFSAASTLSAPEFADARITWAKNAILSTVVDDFFDVGSSSSEQEKLVKLVEQWDENEVGDFCSENVRIIFTAVRHTIIEIAQRAYAWQDRNIADHLIEIWLNLMKSMRKEAEMTRKESIPTLEDYMENAFVSFALGPIVLPTLYFVVPNLSNGVIRGEEYNELFKLMSTTGRLLNDIQGFERESSQGKVNAFSIYLHHNEGCKSKDDAISQLMLEAEAKRRELLRLVMLEKDSVVPRACKEVFWKMSKVLQKFYQDNDGFSAKDMETLVKSVLQDPIVRQV